MIASALKIGAVLRGVVRAFTGPKHVLTVDGRGVSLAWADGAADDHHALQSALDFARHGGVVELPSGVFKLDYLLKEGDSE
jgi:hypothetical protein